MRVAADDLLHPVLGEVRDRALPEPESPRFLGFPAGAATMSMVSVVVFFTAWRLLDDLPTVRAAIHRQSNERFHGTGDDFRC